MSMQWYIIDKQTNTNSRENESIIGIVDKREDRSHPLTKENMSTWVKRARLQ